MLHINTHVPLPAPLWPFAFVFVFVFVCVVACSFVLCAYGHSLDGLLFPLVCDHCITYLMLTCVFPCGSRQVEDQNKTLARELELHLLKEKEYASICSKRARDNKELQAKVGCGRSPRCACTTERGLQREYGSFVLGDAAPLSRIFVCGLLPHVLCCAMCCDCAVLCCATVLLCCVL